MSFSKKTYFGNAVGTVPTRQDWDNMTITYYGHSCFAIATKGQTLLFDPFITPNELAKDISIESIKPDALLISHGHQDHIADAEEIALANNALVISNFEIATAFGEKGLQTHPLNHGGKWTFEFGTVKYVNAIHSSSFPDGRYAGNPGGFVLWNDEGCIYFSGDTALTMDMKLIPMTCPKVNLAILPIGDCFTMGYEDAIIAADFVGCSTVMGCHYDTFGYIQIERAAAQNAFQDAGKELLLPLIGESINL